VGRYTDCAIPANLSSNTVSKIQAVRDRDFNRVKLHIVAATIYSVGISALIMAR
jgi:nitrate/TMAO reductase-like tetraheme cytochrome c subunit